MNRRAKVHLAFALAALVVVAGCGGDGGGGDNNSSSPPTTTTPPPSTTPANPAPPVTQSAYDKFIEYVKAVVQTALDTSEPADVTAFNPAPVSDFAAPVALQ